MLKEKPSPKRVQMLSLLCLSVISAALLMNILPTAKSQAGGVTKPKEFYLHYVDLPVAVAGLETKYIMNTTRLFRFPTQQEAYVNSFFKPIGQPKIAVDFYLYPNLAGPVTINGTWEVFIWANGSAYKPTGFTVEFREVTVEGITLWNSGAIGPTVTSSIGEYIDVPVYNYKLSVPLSRAFNKNSTLHVHVEVLSGSSAETRIWYDSSLFPSKVILPVEDYARPMSIKTYAVDNSETTLFYYNWSANQRKVIVRVNVTDPFGGYDIYKVNMTILDPISNPVIDNVDMTRVTDGQWHIHYSHIFEANWTYSSTAMLGEYTVKVWVIDNNGYYHNLGYGTFEPFIEQGQHVFTIGEIIYYNPAFLVVDDVDDPLPKAQVYITWPNGTTETLPRYTAQNGFINLTHVLSGDYEFTILWKDVLVLQKAQYLDSNGPYTLKCQVYQLKVDVLGGNGVRIHGAYVIIYDQDGVGYGLDITDKAGSATFKLPTGTYEIEAHYSAEYWLTVVTTKTLKPSVLVTSSKSETVTLTEFPPAIWTTTGFWLLILLVAIAAGAVIFVALRSRIATPRAKGKS